MYLTTKESTNTDKDDLDKIFKAATKKIIFPLLIVINPPAILDEVRPADILTEPPTPSVVDVKVHTHKEMSPPWPLTPPP